MPSSEEKRPVAGTTVLSPRLSIYRWLPGSIASVVHRVTGVAILILLPFYFWILSNLLGGAEKFACMVVVLMSSPGKIMLWVSGALLSYHLLNGIRFLLIDFGLGTSPVAMRNSAYMVFSLAALLAMTQGWVLL